MQRAFYAEKSNQSLAQIDSRLATFLAVIGIKAIATGVGAPQSEQ